MIIKEDVLDFIKEGNFSEDNIDLFLDKNFLDEKALIKKSFKVLNLYIADLEPNENDEKVISNTIELLSILCEKMEFNKEDIETNKKRIKKTREAILAIANKYNNVSLINSANKLDEIIIDKNINVDDLIILIKKLIDKKENVNIIKKLISVNKSSILSKDNELFDYVFNLAIDSIKNDTNDKFYYITLLKVVYNSRIDKLKYINSLNENIDSKNVYGNEIYMIIHGVKRSLNSEEILKKYYISEDLPSQSIYIPKNSHNYDDYLITVDNNDTYLRDDALSIKKDGNNYIIGIHISDVASNIKLDGEVDYYARKNFECKFLSGGKRTRIFDDNLEKNLSLNAGDYRSTLSLYIVINDSGDLIDYYFTPNILYINENLTYMFADQLMNHKSNYENGKMLYDLYNIAKALETKNKLRLDYWKIKYINNSFENDPKSETIVREFMILYNTLIAIEAHKEKIPFVYRVQDPEYISSLITDNNIEINDYTNNLIKNIYLESLYSPRARRHTGLNTDIYSKSSSPLRRYPDFYNQHLFHCFYFKDMKMNFDYYYHLELINYFNQRSEELSLMGAEYNREIKLARKKG